MCVSQVTFRASVPSDDGPTGVKERLGLVQGENSSAATTMAVTICARKLLPAMFRRPFRLVITQGRE